jgi:PDZ domain-containing secreted protein
MGFILSAISVVATIIASSIWLFSGVPFAGFGTILGVVLMGFSLTMFAIGIIDKLTPGALTQGKIIAGTGTIEPDGNVGEIGGIQQKLIGARDAGAVLFLAPEGNCDEVLGHIPDGLTVAAIETLDDAMKAIEAFTAGQTVTPCVK